MPIGLPACHAQEVCDPKGAICDVNGVSAPAMQSIYLRGLHTDTTNLKAPTYQCYCYCHCCSPVGRLNHLVRCGASTWNGVDSGNQSPPPTRRVAYGVRRTAVTAY